VLSFAFLTFSILVPNPGCTAATDPATPQAMLDAGCDAVWSKPMPQRQEAYTQILSLRQAKEAATYGIGGLSKPFKKSPACLLLEWFFSLSFGSVMFNDCTTDTAFQTLTKQNLSRHLTGNHSSSIQGSQSASDFQLSSWAFENLQPMKGACRIVTPSVLPLSCIRLVKS